MWAVTNQNNKDVYFDLLQLFLYLDPYQYYFIAAVCNLQRDFNLNSTMKPNNMDKHCRTPSLLNFKKQIDNITYSISITRDGTAFSWSVSKNNIFLALTTTNCFFQLNLPLLRAGIDNHPANRSAVNTKEIIIVHTNTILQAWYLDIDVYSIHLTET